MGALAIVALISSTVAAGTGLEQALALEKKGQDLRALELVDQAVRERPTWELARLEAARLRIKLGTDIERAEHDVEVARAIAPENARAQYLWGLVREERGDERGARRAYEIAVDYRPSYDDARFRLAGLYYSKQAWAQAEAHYRELARRRPEWTQARMQLVAVFEQQGRLTDAEAELADLWARTGSKLAGRKLAELYDRTNQPQKAQKLREALDPSPKKKMRPLKKSRR